MRKMASMMLAVFCLSVLLVSCGGGGSGGAVNNGHGGTSVNGNGDGSGNVVPPINPPAIVPVKHQLTLVHTAAHAKVSTTLKLSSENGKITNLVRNSQPASVNISDVKEVVVSGNCLGWPSAGGTGVIVNFSDVNVDYIPDLPDTQIGMFSIRTFSGEEYFLNTESIELKDCKWPVVIENGLIRWGDAVANPNFTCPAPPPKQEISNQVDIITVGDQKVMEVKLAVENNNILHLVKNGVAVSLAIKPNLWLVWNGANAGWFPPKGIQTALVLPVTKIYDLKSSDVGSLMIYDGDTKESYWFNVDFISSSGLTIDYKNGSLSY